MHILILNGSPRPEGLTKRMAEAFRAGAEAAGHAVTVIDVCRLGIRGCQACEACHAPGRSACVQRDGMDEIYRRLPETDMLVLASPIYYHGFSGQLKCAIDRLYAALYPKERKPRRLRFAALLLASGAEGVYDGAKYSYAEDLLSYLGLADKGVFTASEETDLPARLHEIRLFAASLAETEDTK